MIGALRGKMAAGHLSRRSPDLLRSPRTAALLEMVAPAWAGSSTTMWPLPCGGSAAAGCRSAAAAARSPPPAAAGVGLLATNHHSVMEMPLPPPPLAAGVGLHPTDHLSTGQELPSPPPAAAGVGLHATAPYSSMAVSPTPPLPPAVGVGPRATDPHSSVAVLLPPPPPAAPGVGLHPTDHLSSMELQLPAASGVGLLAVGHHLRRSPVLPLLLRSPRTTPIPAMALPWSSFTPSLPQHGSSAVAKPPVPAAVTHIVQANGGRRGFERSDPSVRKPSNSSTFCISGCGDMQNLMIPNRPSGWSKSNLSRHNTGTGYQSRHYSKDTKIPLIPYDEVLPPPPPPPADLISAPYFDLDSAHTEKMIAQDICAETYDYKKVYTVMEQDNDLVRKFLDVNLLKEIFEESVREALEVRGLLWTQPLEDNPSTRCLHFNHEHIFGDVHNLSYLTTRRLMEILIGMPRAFWIPLLDFLCWQRTIIYLDWTLELTTSISYSIYEFGAKCPPRNIRWYKSESDASCKKAKKGQQRKKGKEGEENVTADVAMFIWMEEEPVWLEIYLGFPCKNSVGAEGLGMYLQLKRSIGLKYLQPYTDNSTIRKVVAGKLVTGSSEEETKFFELLKLMTGYFERVAPRWAPREELTFVDGLLRNPKMVNSFVGKQPECRRLVAEELLEEWRKHLKGDPIFTFVPGKGFRIGKFKANYQMEYHDSCFVDIKEKHRFDAIYHVIRALSPGDVYIIANESQAAQFNDEFVKLSARFDESSVMKEMSAGWATLKMRLSPRFRNANKTKDLIIVVDSAMPRELYHRTNIFVVFLRTEIEKNNLDWSNIPKFSPLSFLSFHQF